eukprot:9977210-Karenia_brevis.AAC.1
MKDKSCQDRLAALEASIDWIPTILGDDFMVGSIAHKNYCEKCNTMPIADGQWFLYRRNNGKQLWICT